MAESIVSKLNRWLGKTAGKRLGQDRPKLDDSRSYTVRQSSLHTHWGPGLGLNRVGNKGVGQHSTATRTLYLLFLPSLS